MSVLRYDDPRDPLTTGDFDVLALLCGIGPDWPLTLREVEAYAASRPWEVIQGESDPRGGVRLWGRNHLRNGDRFVWSIDPRECSLDDRYDFAGCRWLDDGARQIIDEARRVDR